MYFSLRLIRPFISVNLASLIKNSELDRDMPPGELTRLISAPQEEIAVQIAVPFLQTIQSVRRRGNVPRKCSADILLIFQQIKLKEKDSHFFN